MNQFMMNQFAAAAAVNNKNTNLEGLQAFPQQGMINPQTLMYQNQLMYQACTTHVIPIIYHVVNYISNWLCLGSSRPSYCCLLDSTTTTTSSAAPTTSASATDGIPQREQDIKHHRSLGATIPTAVWRRAKVRQEPSRPLQLEEIDQITKNATRRRRDGPPRRRNSTSHH